MYDYDWDSSNDAGLRLNTLSKIHQFYPDGNAGNYSFLARLLGHHDGINLTDHFTEEDRRICRALIGPYGYTFFRMLCSKRGINLSPKITTTG